MPRSKYSDDPETKRECEQRLRSFLCTVAMHSNRLQAAASPIFIVGTHKDE